ncbi:UEV domain-containing protein [Scheffersomyces coipomensis]|uniref:UEV domain-containing protein n=1 Tax=Scheffersomyces coipomensis TaxID=1788519 RepID=UPI00315D105A
MSQQLPGQVANWLYNVLQPQYTHKQLAYSHIYQFLQFHFKQNFNFKIRTNVYTSNDSGQSALLINLFGSIVVNNDLEIPVEIWIPLNYPFVDPRQPTTQINNGTPLVFIIPDHTKQLYLKPGNHVDSQGRFYHPYLANWQRDCSLTQYQSNQESLAQFNLISLINIIHQCVLGDPPISPQPSAVISPNITGISAGGPPIPPKPARIPLNQDQHIVESPPVSQQNSGTTRLPPQTTGPPLPAKPGKVSMSSPTRENSIPLKYQAPLPLPTESASVRQGQTEPQQPPPPVSIPIPQQQYPQQVQPQQFYQNQPPYSAISPQPTHIQRQYYQREHPTHYSSPAPAQQYPVQAGYYSEVSSTPPSRVGQSEVDLMDNEVQNATSNNQTNFQSNIHKQLLEDLSRKINALLDQDSVNIELPIINHNIQKVDALYNQLTHHFQQAKGNSNNLEDHLTYLTQQLNSLTGLNQELSKLETLNNQDPANVWLNQNTSIPLDDLIIPDSPLVKQLYETVSEIKAIKDTIGLISGNFSNGSEIINNNSIDLCVKTVRNLGRDLFWLELTKQEIANNIMGLSSHE